MKDPVAGEKDALHPIPEKDPVMPRDIDIGHPEYDPDVAAPVPSPLGWIAGGRGCAHLSSGIGAIRSLLC